MGIKSALLRPFSKLVARRIDRMAANAVACQDKIFKNIIEKGRNTAFGRDHNFTSIQSHQDFIKNVPVRDYEALKNYVERIKNGESNVLWPGKPRYFAKTSGTTSGVKYIPITKESTSNHFGTARDTMFNYAARTGNFAWLDGFLIFLSGSPSLDSVAGIPTGRLSGISNHLVPAWLRRNQMPSWETNCIDDWEEKLDNIVAETLPKDMRMISGIPPWVVMYYERLLEKTGKKTIREIFPNYSVFAFGGVNFEPYKAKLESLVGGKIDSVEMFPASEGFIAFQDAFPSKGLLLNADSGIFFEFIPLDEIGKPNPTRLTIKEVKTKVNYALILSSNAGLWGYDIGDTIQFISLNPYRLVVSGRVKHYISAFGEHVIGKEVEEAMQTVADREGVRIVEFHVAPQVNPPEGGAAYHEWFVEFDTMPEDLNCFAMVLDNEMTLQNIYYEDLIKGQILQHLKIRPVKRGSFNEYMKSEGKLGGQNKVPRLANDRKIADFLSI
jgi:GH3 auxin-responsive promoter